MKRTVTIAIAMLATTCLLAPVASAGQAKKTLTKKQKLAQDAAYALFGVGLKIKRSKRRHTITISAKPGGLTQQKWNEYVEKVYLPALARMGINEPSAGFRFLTNAKHYKYKPRAKVKRAHLLLEPSLKHSLCTTIMMMVPMFSPYSTAFVDRRNWCATQAMLDATTPIFEYRGKKVVWDDKLERGNLKIDDVIFKKSANGDYPIVVTVAGRRLLMNRSTISFVDSMVGKLDTGGNDKLYRRGQRLAKTARKSYYKLVRRMEAKQRKYARRKKILFSETAFLPWVAHKGAKGPIDCAKAEYLVYSPKRGGQGSYARILKINDAVCVVIPQNANRRERDSFAGMKCKGFESGKTYKLSIALHRRHVTGSFKRVEWRHTKFTNASYDLSKLGRRIYSNSIKCIAK